MLSGKKRRLLFFVPEANRLYATILNMTATEKKQVEY